MTVNADGSAPASGATDTTVTTGGTTDTGTTGAVDDNAFIPGGQTANTGADTNTNTTGNPGGTAESGTSGAPDGNNDQGQGSDSGKDGDANKTDGDGNGSADGVPETYLPPEGMEIYDKELFDSFSATAKELGLSQEKFGELTKMHAKAMEVAAEQQANAFIDLRKTWVTEIQADKELGGDKFDANVAAATKALETFDTNGAFKELLASTGYGDNPAVFRFMVNVANATGSDHPVNTGDGGSAPKSGPDESNPLGYKGLAEYEAARVTSKS